MSPSLSEPALARPDASRQVPRSQAFVHPGPPSEPRIVEVVGKVAHDYRLVLPPGASIGASLRAWLDTNRVDAGCGQVIAGGTRSLDYHVIVRADGGTKPYVYGPAIHHEGETALIGAMLTLGRDSSGDALVHCHAGFLAADGSLHGGHLALDSAIAGAAGMVVALSTFSGVALRVAPDAETHYSILNPFAVQQAEGSAWQH
ncbi:PPC domain-containing DNA-binding protein [Chitinasiproducens palmae]|uniref:Predicted DNA-binding protein with PD1-like DNA-binding motif n=1 Tax=Chitinasiproducens palmae TaxID=1770053 RepID=A0A1H2PTD1_9BURK|nr:DUF296 domain-containing protein [Chitinasiproducens palmae]SDV50364.1 Predicted DNA-binding protein with PD1-like DNA-binding motif [Chitinasiproducens palmae]